MVKIHNLYRGNPITTNPFSITEEELNIEEERLPPYLCFPIWEKQLKVQFASRGQHVIANTIRDIIPLFFYESSIERLCFNSFYEFLLEKIPDIP